MELKPGYKQTEIGVIPDDWEEVRLGDIGYIFGGLTGKSSGDFGSGDANYITFMNVIYNVVSKVSGVEKVSVGAGEHQSTVLPGDVLFNGSSETPEEVGFGSVVPWDLAGTYLNSFCFGFRPNKDSDLDSKFFAYLTRSSLGREIIRPMAQGSTRYNLAKTNLLNGRFPRPPLKEQEAIAEALSDVDALIDSLEALLIKKRNIKTGVMHELLTGRARLPGFSNEWGKTSLDELVNSGVVKLGRGNVISKKDMEADPGSCPVYSSAQNNDGCIGAYNKYMFNEELITWSVDGGGYVFYRPRHKFSVTNICGYLRIIDESKFQYLFFSAVLQKLHSQHTFDWLNKAHPRVIRKLYREIPIVPITEQKAIANVLSDMDDEIEALDKRLAKTRDLKQGMAQELLTGRTRLV